MNTRVIIPLFFISFQACTSVLPRGQESFDTERVESFSNIPQGIVDAFEIEHNNLEIDSVSCVSMPVAGSLTKGDISNAHIYLAYGKDRTCTVFSKINEDVDLIAIIDSTTLSVRHFGSGVLNFVEGEVSEDYSSFWVADYISAYVLNLCNERSLCKSAVLYANETWITDEKIGPLMRTVWHQDSPFNDMLNSVYNVGNYAAGCGPVALGQICAYNGFPSSIDGVTIGWSGVRTVYSYDEYGVFWIC